MYKAVIFDLDGTLLNTTSGVVSAIKETLYDLKLDTPSETVLESFVGPPMQESFEKYFSFNKDKALVAANLFRNNYKKHSLYDAKLYPGVMEMLQFLKNQGYRICVATNKSHDNAVDILNHFGIAYYCEHMLGSDLGGKLEKSDIIMSSLKKIDISACDAVYIGDSVYDLIASEKVGIDFIGVIYGFGFRKNSDLKGHEYIAVCKSVYEVINFFKQNNESRQILRIK